MTEVFIMSAVCTAIGTFGGSLKDIAPTRLAASVAREAIARAAIVPDAIGHVVFGQVISTEPKDVYVSRVAAVEAGVALAGGVECMSRAPFFAPSVRWGRKLGDAALIDALNGTLTDPFGNGLMGVTAENVAARYGIDRATQDAAAPESHRRAAAAIAAGCFVEQILPIDVKLRGKATRFAIDEHVRGDTTLAELQKLPPIFKNENGTVTAGNASDIDVIEANEAYAAQACAVAKELGFDPAKVNPNSSGISLGHPVGATGAILMTKLVYELQRVGGRYGLATMCIGGGQGIAAIIERVP